MMFVPLAMLDNGHFYYNLNVIYFLPPCVRNISVAEKKMLKKKGGKPMYKMKFN